MTDQEGDLGLRQRQVRLAEPNVRWSALFADEAVKLDTALKKYSAVIEHCGSTSVPKLPAKPIIDILVGMRAPIDVAGITKALAPLGYEHAHWAGVPGHEVFGKGEARTHLLHVVPLHGNRWKRVLAFRDALRRDGALAIEYALLKRELAERYSQNRSAYTEGKSRFVETVLARELGQDI
jgi:GrpB-like predicted nucleotidyltransferase (UPF0157 family)